MTKMRRSVYEIRIIRNLLRAYVQKEEELERQQLLEQVLTEHLIKVKESIYLLEQELADMQAIIKENTLGTNAHSKFTATLSTSHESNLAHGENSSGGEPGQGTRANQLSSRLRLTEDL